MIHLSATYFKCLSKFGQYEWLNIIVVMTTPNHVGQKAKAYWTPKYHNMFVELCVEQVQKGNRPTHCFNRAGWDAIIKGLTQKTRLHYEKKQMKNHYYSTKELWKA